jgi:lysozyme
MKTNRAGIELIKAWEGLRTKAYRDAVDVLTIGYGHTSMAGPPIVTEDMRITEDEAGEILVDDLRKFEAAVSKVLSRNPNENQFSAMVSLCFNIGPGNFSKSTLVKKFNAGDIQGAADAFRSWRLAGGKVLQGLVNRREAERQLFLRPVTITHPGEVLEKPENANTSNWLTVLIEAIISIFRSRK